jgi:hypothetical protein
MYNSLPRYKVEVWKNSRSHTFIPPSPTPKNAAVPIELEAGWSPEKLWTVVKKGMSLTHAEIQTPERSVRSEPLYQMRYSGSIRYKGQQCEKLLTNLGAPHLT